MIVRSYSNIRKSNGSIEEWLRALLTFDKLNYNEIKNEQRPVILVYIIKRIFYRYEEHDAFMLGVLLILTFYRISLSTPKTFFILWMVDGVCLNYDGSKMSR